MDTDEDVHSVPAAAPRNFIESRAATFHEAFGVESSFNAALLQYKPTEVTYAAATRASQHGL